MDLNRGTSIALAVSALLAAGACSAGAYAPASSTADPIRCEGGNACRAKSEGATADDKSLCSGENACKGPGYVSPKTQEQCTALQIRNKPGPAKARPRAARQSASAYGSN